MPQFRVKARKTSPNTLVDVTADTRELAIAQVVATAAEGEEIEVMDCVQLPDNGGNGGSTPTGATGTSR